MSDFKTRKRKFDHVLIITHGILHVRTCIPKFSYLKYTIFLITFQIFIFEIYNIPYYMETVETVKYLNSHSLISRTGIQTFINEIERCPYFKK